MTHGKTAVSSQMPTDAVPRGPTNAPCAGAPRGRWAPLNCHYHWVSSRYSHSCLRMDAWTRVPFHVDYSGRARRRATIPVHAAFRRQLRGPPCHATATAVLAVAAIMATCSITTVTTDPDPLRDYPKGATHDPLLPQPAVSRDAQVFGVRFWS